MTSQPRQDHGRSKSLVAEQPSRGRSRALPGGSPDAPEPVTAVKEGAREGTLGSPALILGIETSCDETASAVVTQDGRVLSSIVSSQATLHARYGGVVPPFLCLLASGGHTLLLAVRERGRSERLGTTLDDAAGEAFDKGARLLGLGYPGGAEIDRLAQAGDAQAFPFPVARVPGLDFSFSGLKTALLYAVRDLGPEETERRKADLAASYQHAIVRALVGRAREALAQTGLERLAVVGGVAANSELREALPDARFASLELCTD